MRLSSPPRSKKKRQANEALRKSEKDLQHAALYDSLTDLPNRKHFGDMLRKLIDEYKDDPSVDFSRPVSRHSKV